MLLLVVTNHNNMCFKRRRQLKPKESKINNKKNVYRIDLLKLVGIYNMVGLINNLLSSMRSHYKIIGMDCKIILLQFNRLKTIKSVMQSNNLWFQNRLQQRKFENKFKGYQQASFGNQVYIELWSIVVNDPWYQTLHS